MRYTRTPADQAKFEIFTVGSLVFLFTNDREFINVWHVDNLSSKTMKPGSLGKLLGVR